MVITTQMSSVWYLFVSTGSVCSWFHLTSFHISTKSFHCVTPHLFSFIDRWIVLKLFVPRVEKCSTNKAFIIQRRCAVALDQQRTPRQPVRTTRTAWTTSSYFYRRDRRMLGEKRGGKLNYLVRSENESVSDRWFQPSSYLKQVSIASPWLSRTPFRKQAF